jgi:hypothetical protein
MSLVRTVWEYLPSLRAFVAGTIALLFSLPALASAESFGYAIGFLGGVYLFLYFGGGFVWDLGAGLVGRVRGSPGAE